MRFSEQEMARMAEWIYCLAISGDNEEKESGISKT
jgi:hypothetical protein